VYVRVCVCVCVLGNESVPQIIINDTKKFIFKTAISILLISNHNSFRVLPDFLISDDKINVC